MDTRIITAQIPLPLADKVDDVAERLERSPEWVVKQALSAWIEQEEERRRLTLEGLADVKAGITVDHDKVAAWVESLGTDNPLPLPR